VNRFNEVVCKAIELLVTCRLVIFGLNFRSHFRYDQEGNVLLQSAVIHLKQDGRRITFQASFPGFVFFTCHWRFLSQQIVTMNLGTLFTQHNGFLQAFGSRGRRL